MRLFDEKCAKKSKEKQKLHGRKHRKTHKHESCMFTYFSRYHIDI